MWHMRRQIQGWRMSERMGAWAHGRVAMLLLALTCAYAPTRLPAQSLARRLDRRLDAAPFNRNMWGVVVIDDKGRTVYARNADRLFVPASNTKIVVSAVASALLSPDFRVKTSIYGTGPVANGVLEGDLILYGRGDPTFAVRCYSVDTLA